MENRAEPIERNRENRAKRNNIRSAILSLRVSSDVKNLLEMTSRKRRCSISALLRELLQVWVLAQNGQSVQAGGEKVPGVRMLGIRRAKPRESSSASLMKISPSEPVQK